MEVGGGHCDHCLLFRDLSDTISREVQDMRGTREGFKRGGGPAEQICHRDGGNVMRKKKKDNDKEAD